MARQCVCAILKGTNYLTLLHLLELFTYARIHWWTLLFEFLSEVILTIPLLARWIVVILCSLGIILQRLTMGLKEYTGFLHPQDSHLKLPYSLPN